MIAARTPERPADARPNAFSLGVAASLGASVLFGALFLIPPMLQPLDGLEIVAWRILATVPVLVLLVGLTGGLRDVGAVLARIRRRPALAIVLVVDAALLGVQLWLFGWAPISGHGLDTATGYLLLPLALVVVGTVLHGERLSRIRSAAVVAAAVGVLAALLLGGAVGIATLIVALGYPVYFDLRRRFRLDSPGATVLEQAVLLPAAIALLAVRGAEGTIAATWSHAPVIMLLGAVSGLALWLYLSASRVLPLGLFGLLSYLEPVLLVAVSALLLDEQLGLADALVYGPIACALLLLAIETARRRPAGRRVDDAPQSAIRSPAGESTHQTSFTA
ncbi:EamA family transporter RarD [Agrococcus beijingensis]|uniref:EamA family transporter RarD n=1 Tax=Agrococcus beijingensis TaxID=3068634 RepID=UPI002740A115|nr:EamA family transporter RarD [Agrococcus sp. REN33]